MKSENKIEKLPIKVAYFSTPQCNVCKVLRPKVEALVAEYDQIEFEYINTEEHPQLAGQRLIFAVPTIIVFVEGREAKRFSRSTGISDIQSFLDRVVKIMDK